MSLRRSLIRFSDTHSSRHIQQRLFAAEVTEKQFILRN
jgi:hypothetical protein